MKSFLKFSICFAILTITFAGCGKDDKNPLDSSLAKLSPPSWIQGTWSVDKDGKYPVFKFTSDDILEAVSFSFDQAISLRQFYQSNVVAGVTWTVKETSNNSLYELTFTSKVSGETTKHIYSFKRGDGTYIELGTTTDEEPIEDYGMLYKVK